jgi:UDP-N-acetylmuramoyl-L-alanyl-D-glutamate--2,6-diaminopimelate ligase
MSAQPVLLSDLLAGFVPVSRNIPLTDITLDSRQVRPGGAFLACRGSRHHGLDFAASVAAKGAAAILWEPDGSLQPPEFSSDIVVTAVPQLSARVSSIANRFFGSPSQHIDVVGVTGTNGKTTCAWLLAQALTACDRPAAYLGTLGSRFAGVAQPGEHTTPDAITTQRLLSGFAGQGAAAVAMEVSSHALVQHRVAAVQFNAAVFTNLTRDHLDYHGDMASYAAAKATLFERDEIRLRVFNVDDAFGASLAARPEFRDRIACTQAEVTKAVGPYVRACKPRFTTAGMEFDLDSSFGSALINTPLMGDFNVDNVLAVLAVLLGSGVPVARCAAAMRQLQAPSGRLESFAAAHQPLVVVDYAHTPDALAKALAVLRRHCAGKLIVVFGCGGDRDRGKRPQMGVIAKQLADVVVLTDDNPRGESAKSIVADILAGVGSTATVIHDRAAAIEHAVSIANPDDVVLVAGKGHEDYQIIGDEKRPFSDQRVVRAALSLAGAA